MPEIVLGDLSKIVLFMVLLGGFIAVLLIVAYPYVLQLIGAINTAFSNLIAAFLG